MNIFVEVPLSQCDTLSVVTEYMYMLTFFFSFCRPSPPVGADPKAFVLGVSKKEQLIQQELLAVNRFLYCRGLPVIGQGDEVESHRQAVVNGAIFSCARWSKSKLRNSYTVQYEDAKGSTQFGEIQRFVVLKGYHVAVITNLAVNGSLVSPITSSELLNNFADSGVLVHHIVVTKRSNISFCIPLCRIKRMCIVVSTSGDDILTLRTFPNLVEHD